MPNYPRGPGGSHGAGVDDVWADTLGFPCSHCGVPADVKCRNKLTDTVMPVPHYHRIQAAEKTTK